MTYHFGERSREYLDTCHPDLVRVAEAVIQHRDFSVIEGHRTLERQIHLYSQHLSTLDGVSRKSKHQEYPSRAMDVLPYPGVLHGKNVWGDSLRFAHFAGVVLGTAQSLCIALRWGGDWNADGSCADHKLVDMPHFELIDQSA